jgi:hypothetical protein
MIVALVIVAAGLFLVLGQLPLAKKAGRVALGLLLVATCLPCIIGSLGSSPQCGFAPASGVSDTLSHGAAVLIGVIVVALLGRWAFKRWLAAKPAPPIPASPRRRVDLPQLSSEWADDFREDEP